MIKQQNYGLNNNLNELNNNLNELNNILNELNKTINEWNKNYLYNFAMEFSL